MSDVPWQRELCSKYDAEYFPCQDNLKVGISTNFSAAQYPINGLRHRPAGDTTGWYIWSGENFSLAADFFVPLHATHLKECCPDVLRFLGLAPGWRFLCAPNQEDVWFDPSLLNI